MKTTVLVVSILIISILSISAQGVILGPGDTLAFGFDRADSCRITEFAPGSVVTLAFG